MEPTAKRSSQGMMCILLFVMITTLSISPSNALRCSIGFITPSSLDHIPAGTASCNPGNGERTCTLSSCHGSGPTGTMLLSSFVFHDCEDEFEKKRVLLFIQQVSTRQTMNLLFTVASTQLAISEPTTAL
ncbi:hypothetical protein H4Q26_012363 [Puccinia striiformis f. sp. tritici PST-130]|nr:hypothetical protein H4Q26_012363 [Puccinia striiformis f. sp. tritici PST-130]